MRATWPSHLSCVAARVASTLSMLALLRTSTFETRSDHFIRMMRLRWRCCTASNLRMCALYSVYVSAEYSNAGRTTALYTLHLVESLFPGLVHSLLSSFPKEAHALCIRQLISLSALQSVVSVLPKYLKLGTTFSVSPSTVIAGSTGHILVGDG